VSDIKAEFSNFGNAANRRSQSPVNLARVDARLVVRHAIDLEPQRDGNALSEYTDFARKRFHRQLLMVIVQRQNHFSSPCLQ
jgi:hypothetical protein